MGKTLDRGREKGQEYPYLCSINVYWDRIDLTKVKRFLLEDDERERYRLYPGDLLICEGGDYGRCCVWDRNEEMYYQNALHRVRFYGNIIVLLYKYVFELYRHNGYIVGQGQTIKHFTYENMKNLLFPVPPINEQKRIITMINSIIPFVQDYGKSYNRLQYLNNSIEGKLKKSILQEAIQGRLVEQDPNDEPASVLLEHIRTEKQRLVKEGKLKKSALQDSVIYRGDDNKYYEKVEGIATDITDQIPFDIPLSWEWVRLKTICRIFTGATFKKEEAKQQGENRVRILRGGNISPFKLLFKGDDVFIDKSIVNEYILLRENDLVTPAVTSLDNICKMARVEEDYNDVTVGGFVFIIRGFKKDKVLARFLQCFFSCPATIEFVKSITNKSGQAFYNIGKERLSKTIVPIPPYSEMKRITTQVDKIFQSLN